MEKVRIGIIGLGTMGMRHAEYIGNGKVAGAELTAVASGTPEKLLLAKTKWGDGIHRYMSGEDLCHSVHVDAVIICTPHYNHPDQANTAFHHGLHVLVEKPVAVFTKQARLMNEAARKSGKVFGVMYNLRTNPLYVKLREWIASGKLGEIQRINWIATDWYRSQVYYDESTWRATWAGEGGGVLINQSLHQLDLLQWITGIMPTRIRSFCSFGKRRNIEAENEVTAYAEYENGATGVFITSTIEAPGTNRFEVTGDRGKAVIENGLLTLWQLEVAEPEFNLINTSAFTQPGLRVAQTFAEYGSSGLELITTNWVEAILHSTRLLAPGEEGIKALMLANAILLSSWLNDWVELPFDEDLFADKLEEKILKASSLKSSREK
ncbi:MAG: Gfo/Idh/MocA family oxidoreductase, partial [Gorillibacterium sp.]|nr:Gfo/Idh/MocA family oxidoreductase [Gorillibacterium sp.]